MGEFELKRSTKIDAPATAVYPLIASFREWTKWSPWEDVDPDLQRTYTGAESGVGATYAWAGNRKAGEGRMEITEATEPGHVGLDLQFLKPFKALNRTTFGLVESGGATTVTWTMTGTQAGFMRVMSLLFSLEKTVGPDFERGLAALKAEVEGATAAA